MPIDNDGNKGMLTGVNSKQKMMVVVIVLAAIVVVWQVMGMMGEGSGEMKPAPATASNKNAAVINSANPSAANKATQPTQVVMNQNEDMAPRQASLSVNSELLKQQQQIQAKYIAELNQLQMLKLQKEIAETNQAITSSKLATVTAEQSITDLLVKPAPLPVPASAYANNLVNAAMSGQSIATDANNSSSTTVKTTKTVVESSMPSYVVLSISMQDHKWSAVIGLEGKLYNVSVGDILPVDGSVISSIDTDEVVLTKNDKKKKLRIVSTI